MNHPVSKKEISIYGSTVRYWIYKSKTKNAPIIFALHGFRGTHHGLEDIVAALPEATFIIPDLPGFNESTPMTRRKHNIAGYSAFALAFINKVVPKNSILLGHSFGSIVASNIAKEKPKNIQKLILINPIAKPQSTINKALGQTYYQLGTLLPESASRVYFANKPSVFAISVYLAKTKDKTLRKQIHSKHLTHFSSYANKQVMKESFKASVSTSVSDSAQEIALPTLLIAGAKDGIAKLKDQKELKEEIKNAKLVVEPSTGHLVHYEAPEFAAKAIKNFIKT
ncbi:alpha/beta hydrolase [Candidatus Saccharibacteria bacterium]|nr:alpha/beta hydrolase [Candidatus Saccharibacteria bacterium]